MNTQISQQISENLVNFADIPGLVPSKRKSSFHSKKSEWQGHPQYVVEEFQKSAIPSELRLLSIKYLSNRQYITSTEILNQRGNIPDDIEGWFAETVDLDDYASNAVQFKPKVPQVLDGRELKYVSQSKPENAPKSKPRFHRWHVVSFLALRARYPEYFKDKDGNPISFEYDPKTGEVFGVNRFIIEKTNIPINIGEGDKKTLCLMANGFFAIAVIGCYVGDVAKYKNKFYPGEFYHPLKGLPTREINIFLDGDEEDKEEIAKAKARFACLEYDPEYKHHIYFPMWKEEFKAGYKGIDDVVAHYGSERLQTILERSLTITEWQAQVKFKSAVKKELKACLPTKITKEGQEIFISNSPEQIKEYEELFIDNEEVRDMVWEKYLNQNLIYHKDRGFMGFGKESDPLSLDDDGQATKGNGWRYICDADLTKELRVFLKNKDIKINKSSAVAEFVKVYLKQVALLLDDRDSDKLEFFSDITRYSGFQDGVIDLHTGEYHQGFGRHLLNPFVRPFKYKPKPCKTEEEFMERVEKACPKIYQALYRSQKGNKYEILRNLVAIKSCFYFWLPEFQVFFHFIGPAGTSKSVMLKLIGYIMDFRYFSKKRSLVTNVKASNLKDDTSCLDAVRGITLIIDEAEKIDRTLQDLIKNVTSKTAVTARRAYSDHSESIVFPGNLLIGSNDDPFRHGESEGIARRRIPFTYAEKVREDEIVPDFERTLIDEVPALLNLLLPLNILDKKRCKQILKTLSAKTRYENNAGEGGFFKRYIPQFMNEWLIPCSGEVIAVQELYKRFIEQNPTNKNYTANRFSDELRKNLEYFKDHGWDIITYYTGDQYKKAGYNKAVATLANCRLRTEEDAGIHETYSFMDKLQADKEEEAFSIQSEDELIAKAVESYSKQKQAKASKHTNQDLPAITEQIKDDSENPAIPEQPADSPDVAPAIPEPLPEVAPGAPAIPSNPEHDIDQMLGELMATDNPKQDKPNNSQGIAKQTIKSHYPELYQCLVNNYQRLDKTSQEYQQIRDELIQIKIQHRLTNKDTSYKNFFIQFDDCGDIDEQLGEFLETLRKS